MQEETNLEQNAEVYESLNAEESTDGVTQDETIEYIDVREQDAYVVEVDEAFASTENGETSNHALLTNRDLPGQHPIGAIDGLQGVLDNIQSLKSGLYASSGGLAEFREWADGNPTWDNRSGYFVSVVNGDGEIAICDKQVSDVYGVVVPSGAFCGYQDEVNKSGNPLYAMVCLVGNVKVRIREDSDIVAGDYVVADNYGYAIKSENDVGFRVLSIGTDPILEYYASITLVPQNDNVSRVMEGLSATNDELSNVIIQLGNVEDALIEVEKNSNTAIEVAGDVKDITDILNEAVGSMGVKLENVTDIANQAKDSAERIMNDANAIYTDAVSTANSAKEDANSALGDINTLKTNLNPLVAWEGEEGSSVAGFVAQADDDHTELSSLVARWGENGTDLIAVRQQIDSNGASIQNLVAHADKYSVGPHSLSYKLTYDEAMGILQPGYIYVATDTHTETSDLYICSAPTEVAENTSCYFTVGDVKYGFPAPKRIYNSDTIKCNIATRELIIDDETYPVDIVQDIIDMVEMQFVSEYTYTFESVTDAGIGKSYIWEQIENADIYTWKEYSDVYFNPIEELQEDDLWFCSNGVAENGKPIYYPETLYRWDGIQWISVATIDGNLQARTLGLVKQTANELTSTYTNLRGDVSVMKQTVNEISTTVSNVDGKISSIEQTADSIVVGTFNSEGASSLSQLLNYSFTTATKNQEIIKVNSFEGAPMFVPEVRYSQSPVWDASKGQFVFNETYIDPDGVYYFADPSLTDFFVKDVDGGYEYYTIGNLAISELSGRVSDTEATLVEYTEFKTDTNETLTILEQKTNANSASISSVATGKYAVCTEIAGADNISSERYDNPPMWNDGKFVFEGNVNPGGDYYMLEGDDQSYYKLIPTTLEGYLYGYEKYEMASTGSASIMQKVTDNGSAIGMVVDSNGVKGQVLVEAINGQSIAVIEASKIGINGTAIFTDNIGDGSTTISGNYIRSGVLQSNNYSASTGVFAQQGTKIDLSTGAINSKNFNIDAEGNLTMGQGVITWNNIEGGKPPSGVSSSTVASMIRSVTKGEDTYGGTFISGTTIKSPTIIGAEFYAVSKGRSYATMINNEFAIYDTYYDETTQKQVSTVKASLGYDPSATDDDGGLIELVLGAGWQGTTNTIDIFKISKDTTTATLSYQAGDNTAYSITFAHDGITTNGMKILFG